MSKIEAADRRDYRVFWQSLFNPHSKFAYPAAEPLMTLDEAQEAAREENQKGYLRAQVIGRDGPSA